MDFDLRPMQPDDWDQVAELIYSGTNHWYQSHGKSPIFTKGPQSTRLFCEVYEDLDPGCCLLAVEQETNQIAGSCFYHPRDSHVSLGIMNVHPDYFGKKIAGRLLRFVIDVAASQRKPVRLVSSALNLDSFSLYTRAGFVPQTAYQDMYLPVPEYGLGFDFPGTARVRDATLDDVLPIVALETEIHGVTRPLDYRYFIENRLGIWHVSVLENESGSLDGFLVSVNHDGSNMLGPGIARTDEQAAVLIHSELNHNRGLQPVFLIPVDRGELVETMYRWGARNCEIHFSQVLGYCPRSRGVVMPTFMPETG